MTKNLSDEIIQFIADYSERDAKELSGDSAISDLGIHSLEMTEIVLELEDKYGVEADSIDAWQSFQTVNEIVEAVRGLLTARAVEADSFAASG